MEAGEDLDMVAGAEAAEVLATAEAQASPSKAASVASAKESAGYSATSILD